MGKMLRDKSFPAAPEVQLLALLKTKLTLLLSQRTSKVFLVPREEDGHVTELLCKNGDDNALFGSSISFLCERSCLLLCSLSTMKLGAE